MKRIVKVLVATALTVVLMASGVSPAYAYHDYEEHYKGQTDNPVHGYAAKDPYWTGNEKDTGGNDADQCVYGKTAEGDSPGADNQDGYWECKGNIYK